MESVAAPTGPASHPAYRRLQRTRPRTWKRPPRRWTLHLHSGGGTDLDPAPPRSSQPTIRRETRPGKWRPAAPIPSCNPSSRSGPTVVGQAVGQDRGHFGVAADKDRVHRPIEVVVDAASAGALEERERPVVHVEHGFPQRWLPGSSQRSRNLPPRPKSLTLRSRFWMGGVSSLWTFLSGIAATWLARTSLLISSGVMAGLLALAPAACPWPAGAALPAATRRRRSGSAVRDDAGCASRARRRPSVRPRR